AVMNGVDAIIFTAGLGENAVETREDITKNLEWFGINLDKEKNKVRGKEKIVSTDDSKVKIIVIPTNEELMIARDTLKLI
ncbi:MAG: acetate kinase, partial [Clostridium sp.]|nr:acetate kinase [Clostridium sp.]